MDNEQVKRFIKDPHFPLLMQYLEGFFESMLELKHIDTNRSSDAVHAELIAFQKVTDAFENLKLDTEAIRNEQDKKIASFR